MKSKPAFSFEFFPPRDQAKTQALWATLIALADLKPSFVSVTYGAGGHSRENTHLIIKRILDETKLVPAAHLTCVAQTQAELCDIVQLYWREGVRHIVALRGDMPDMGPYRPHREGFVSTPQFVAAIKRLHDFEVTISAYPERHPDSVSLQADLELLKLKIDAGADRAITQFCFDDDAFLRLKDRAAQAGITIPIIPGIIQTTNFKGIAAMAKKCGAHIPRWMAEAYHGTEHNLEERRKIAIDIALKQCFNFIRSGVDHFHFYTLNQTKVTKAVCAALLGGA